MLDHCWGRWRAGWRWSSHWNRLSGSGGWRFTCSLGIAACVGILWGAIVPKKAAGRLVLTKHFRVSSDHRVHLVVARQLNTAHHLFSDLSEWVLNELFCFLYRGAQEAFFGHFGHIQCKAHVGMSQLYQTFLPSRSCRHFENLQDSSCCF
jgi:hypothetical protein